jgi:hypothetical protein
MPSFVRTAAIGRLRSRRASLALVVAALPFTGGCYKYLPAQVDPAPVVGQDVRLVVTREGATELAQVAEMSNSVVPQIEGRLESTQGTAFMIRVRQRNDVAQPGMGNNIAQLVRVPTNQIIGVELRELDVPMTALAIGGIVGGGTVLLLRIIDAVGSDNSQDVIDPSLSFRVPFSFGIGRSP